MWQIQPTTQWEREQKYYEKKHPNELAAVLRNLHRYVNQLNIAPNARSVMAGYIHPEPKGVVAIDQKGGGSNLQQTRLYIFPDEATNMLYIITIGNKNTQSDDIRCCKQFVDNLRISTETSTGT
jgi:hypothetical protein